MHEKFTLFMFYKRRRVRDVIQILFEKKETGPSLFEKVKTVPKAGDAEFGEEAILMIICRIKYSQQPQFVFPKAFSPYLGHLEDIRKALRPSAAFFVRRLSKFT